MGATRALRLAARFAARRFRELHPYEVQVNLLNACNLKCVYCSCPEVKVALLTTSQWKETIRGLARLGTLRLRFQGGEPTLRQDFCQLSAAARQAGILTAVTTNGLEMAEHPQWLDHLDEVVFSLDAADPRINDRLRGAGTHARVLAAIDVARARRVAVYVNMVVTRLNLNELEPMIELCEGRGLKMNAQPVVFGRRYSDDSAGSLALADGELRDVLRRLAEWRRQGRPVMFSAETYERVAAWRDFSVLTQRTPVPSRCFAGRFYVHIEANGDVHPCNQHGASLVPKNVVRDGLEPALRNVLGHDCGDCASLCLTERKALYALKPGAVLAAVRRV